MTMTTEQREEYVKAIESLDERTIAIRLARKPIDDQLAPFIEQEMQVDEEREDLIDKAGFEFVGRCEGCGKVLLTGDHGSRPYDDDDGIIFCAEHGMTYGDAQRNWADMPTSEDDEDQAESRKHVTEMIEAHLGGGGVLTDLLPTYPL